MLTFFNSFSTFFFSSVISICNSWIGLLIGFLIICGAICSMVYHMANRGF